VRLGRIVGRVVSTVRAKDLDGEKLLLLQPLDARREPAGATLVACDVAQSGLGDLVVWVGGREAALALPRPFVPVDATVVGHVEQTPDVSGRQETAADPRPRNAGAGEPRAKRPEQNAKRSALQRAPPKRKR
jgi:ethanolamine utilization protein EutN